MDFARGQTAGRILAVAILEGAAVECIVEWRGQEIVGHAVAEACEEIVPRTESLVDADVELVVGFASFEIGKVIAA